MHRVTALFLLLLALLLPQLSAVPDAQAQQAIRLGASLKSELIIMDIWERILIEAYRRAGHEVEFQRLPPRRALTDADSGALDGLVARSPIVEPHAPNLVPVPTALLPVDFTAFVARDDIAVTGWESLRGLRIASIKGVVHVEENTQGMPVHYVDTLAQAFSMLVLGRVDVVVFDRMSGEQTVRSMGIKNVRALSPSLDRIAVHHYLHNAHRKTLLPRLDAALRAMHRDGTTRRMIDQGPAPQPETQPCPPGQ